MRTGVLAEDEKHRLGSHQANRFEWHRRILPRQDGSKAHPHAQQTGLRFIHYVPNEVAARKASSAIPTEQPATRESFGLGPGPYSGTIAPQTFPSLPLPFPSGPMYLGQTHPVVPMPNINPPFTFPNPPHDRTGVKPSLGNIQTPKNPEIKPKTTPKQIRKTPRRPKEAKSSTQAAKRLLHVDDAAKAPSAESSFKAPDQTLEVDEEVIEAANILVAMSQGGYASDLLAVPGNTVADKGAVVTSRATQQPDLLPVSTLGFLLI